MPFIVFFIFCLFIVVAFFGWWTLLLIPLFIGAAILDGIIKDNDARKRAERDKEQAYRERIEECDVNLRSSKGKEAREKCQREKTLAVRAYMRYCRRTEARLSHQQGRRAARKLQKLQKNRAEWWEANTGQAHPY